MFWLQHAAIANYPSKKFLAQISSSVTPSNNWQQTSNKYCSYSVSLLSWRLYSYRLKNSRPPQRSHTWPCTWLIRCSFEGMRTATFSQQSATHFISSCSVSKTPCDHFSFFDISAHLILKNVTQRMSQIMVVYDI